MPFPPASRPKSLSREVTEKLLCPSQVLPVRATDKKSSIDYRLKQLGKKATQYKSKLPTSHATSMLRLEGKSAWITSPQLDGCSSSSTNASRTSSLGTTSGRGVSATRSSKGTSPNSGSATSTSASSPRASSGSSDSSLADKNGEAMSFSLSLTPEAVVILQRRSHEKQLRVARSTSSKAALRQRELSAKSGPRSNIPLVKISLLNDHHQYDDVEYEEVVEQGVDQSVLLKCTEWLRGVEKASEVSTLGKVVKSNQKTI
ncbi:proline-rich protein 18 [Colossoma macropomum]|uniref:proline-rich protein 18 n=1 Tax=Colossoma macropomum TaxID=42526 RepID=UPI001863C298|nr:proline-rich protein 18 [Colossoma macropomum]